DVELPANDVIAGSAVAADVDALDVRPRPLVDDENHVDEMRRRIPVAARTHLGKGVTALRHLDRHVLAGLLHRLDVVDRAGLGLEHRAQAHGIEITHVGENVDAAEMGEVAFLDDEGDDEPLPRRVILRNGGNDLDVGEALAQIKAAQQVAIRLDAIGIVDVVALEKAEDPALAGLDDVLEARPPEGTVSDKDDLADRGFVALGDLEHQIDAIVRQLDDLRLDAHVEASGMVIDVDDSLHVRLHHRARQRPARLRLHFSRELIVLDALVAFESDPVDDWSLDDGHDQPAAGLADSHVLEQAGGVERLETVINGGRVEVPAGAGTKIRANGVGLDPP